MSLISARTHFPQIADIHDRHVSANSDKICAGHFYQYSTSSHNQSRSISVHCVNVEDKEISTEKERGGNKNVRRQYCCSVS